MSPDGVVPPAEATVFEPGTLNPLVRVDGGTAALAVCADVGRPAHAASAAARGADTYLASMFVIPSEIAGDAARLQAYAARHSMAVVFSNYGGKGSVEDLAAMLRSHTHHHHPIAAELKSQIALYADELKLVKVIKPSTDSAKFAERVYADVLSDTAKG